MGYDSSAELQCIRRPELSQASFSASQRDLRLKELSSYGFSVSRAKMIEPMVAVGFDSGPQESLKKCRQPTKEMADGSQRAQDSLQGGAEGSELSSPHPNTSMW